MNAGTLGEEWKFRRCVLECRNNLMAFIILMHASLLCQLPVRRLYAKQTHTGRARGSGQLIFNAHFLWRCISRSFFLIRCG